MGNWVPMNVVIVGVNDFGNASANMMVRYALPLTYSAFFVNGGFYDNIVYIVESKFVNEEEKK